MSIKRDAFYGDHEGQFGKKKTPQGKQAVGRMDMWDRENKPSYSKERKFLRMMAASLKDDHGYGKRYFE